MHAHTSNNILCVQRSNGHWIKWWRLPTKGVAGSISAKEYIFLYQDFSICSPINIKLFKKNKKKLGRGDYSKYKVSTTITLSYNIMIIIIVYIATSNITILQDIAIIYTYTLSNPRKCPSHLCWNFLFVLKAKCC